MTDLPPMTGSQVGGSTPDGELWRVVKGSDQSLVTEPAPFVAVTLAL